jgi:hypothetical protein
MRRTELTGDKILPAHGYQDRGKYWCGLLPGLVLFRFVVSPLQTGVVWSYPVQVLGSPVIWRWREQCRIHICGHNQRPTVPEDKT